MSQQKDMLMSRDKATKSMDLRRLLAPRSVAVVGASPDPNSVSGRVRRNLKLMGYRGDVHLVSRTRDEVDGERCLKSLDELPMGVDAAVLVVPQAAVEESIQACARRGVGAAAVFASGFAEGGDAGMALQANIARIANEHGIALLGPNCMGLINFHDGVPLSFEEFDPEIPLGGPRVAIVGQSGAMTSNTRLALLARGLRVTHSVSTGNEAVVHLEQLMAHLVEREEVDMLTVFAETLRYPQMFLECAARARQLGKPIVMLHPGRSQEARDAAKSHTGALAGDHEVMRALVRREGVAIVDTLDELFDVTALLARYPEPPSSHQSAVISNSGALRGIAIDVNADLGVPLAKLGTNTLASLAEALPAFVTPDNPLDITTAGMQSPALFGESARLVLSDDKVGSLVIALMGGLGDAQVAKAHSILPVVEKFDKPVAFVIMGDEAPLDERFVRLVKESHVPFFRSPDRALRAMAHVHHRARALERSNERARASGANAGARLPAGPLAEYKGKQLLQSIGIATPAGSLGRSVEHAVDIADSLGYPVVLKAQADQLMHKSDVGGVAVGIPSAEALREAWAHMQASVSKGTGGMALDGILVESLAPKGVELLLGAKRDPQWGVVMMLGLGGVWVEALNDVLLLPADMTPAQIAEEMKRLKGAALLDGLRGSPPVDVAAVSEAVSALAQWVLAHPEVVEVDINPLIALPRGQGVVALDAVFVASD
ncbi:acetate--CoA ligase family protein [Hydrogenophaga palleronii]|uniref:acetate--CoA ligase family protein n=1 Tax=Hydrogenophaga palleronii TaxID=65655 RepID=UPI000AB64E10|nr:acetate--CoA ligase family protein [Hydrogenophaga palleronii]